MALLNPGNRLTPNHRLTAETSALAPTFATSPIPAALVCLTPHSPTRPARPARATRLRPRRCAPLNSDPEAGTTTAEYAIGTLAACAFAAVLYKILTGASVAAALGGLIHRALGMAG